MNIRLLPTLGLAALSSLGFGTRATAGIFSNNIDMLVVAERMDGSRQADAPASYIAFDGGYIEAGDPIAGDTAPTAAQVSQSLQSALETQGIKPAGGAPAVVLTYHWGVLRVDHRQIRVPYGIKTNEEARIELVSTRELGAEVENHIIQREKGGAINSDASSPPILVGATETVREDSVQPRIFVIVSAYDYQGLVHHEAKLLWRVKLSAREQSGEMDEVIPALIAGGAPFFGRNLSDVQTVEVTPRAAPTGGAPAPGVSPDALHMDRQFINTLLKSEHQSFSGMPADSQM